MSERGLYTTLPWSEPPDAREQPPEPQEAKTCGDCYHFEGCPGQEPCACDYGICYRHSDQHGTGMYWVHGEGNACSCWRW